MSTRRSVRCTATRSRVPPTATRGCWAITRCWRLVPTPARCSMPACGRARRTPPGGSCGSSTNSSPAWGRAGGGEVVIVRADSGFYQDRLLGRLSQAGVGYTATIPQRAPVRTAIDAIAERAWQRIDYPDGEAHVAECVYRGRRLIVRRVRNHHGPQGQLFATWRYHAFVTNLAGSAWALDRQHRAHAVVELSIRDLKAGPLAHLPSGSFHANGAWLQCAVLAHNLLRWTATLGGTHTNELLVAKSYRHRLLDLPGRLVNRSGRPTLRLPARWPWAERFLAALDALRALPPVPG